MANPSLTPYPGAAHKVRSSGVSLVALYGPMVGGWITNPSSEIDQGLSVQEPLFVDPVGPAALSETATTVVLQPGDTWFAPANLATNVYVNAASSGHKFSSIILQPQTQYPPTDLGGTFPPSGPTGLINVIPSYLYEEYQDDDNLQAFVSAYNALAQEYVDWFNQVELPVYTNPNVFGGLLDWVALGLYGMQRPSLASGLSQNLGPYGTFAYNELPYNGAKVIGPPDVSVTTDDTFKRILTWHLYKGDGKRFNVRWLKRRVMRFLFGENGTDYNIDETYPVSVTFGTGNEVEISLIAGTTKVLGGAYYNGFAFNAQPINGIEIELTPQGVPAFAPIFKEAVESGVLELPFQYQFDVRI